MIRTIIIDDEPLALRQMKSYVERLDEFELVGTFRNTSSAESCIVEGGVDLIFCDINMPHESGVEFVRRMQQHCESEGGVVPMVIFTTAHSEYAIEGFRLDAVDYLLKPISFDDVAASAARAHSLYTLRSGVAIADNAEQRLNSSVGTEVLDEESYITVKADYKMVPIKVSDIVFLESEGEYIRLHLESGRSVTTFYRLKNMETELPASQFMRIHRSYIVNLNSIVSYERGRVYISEREYLPIGQNYREQFLQAMSGRR